MVFRLLFENERRKIFLSDAPEKDGDTLTDKINNGIITMDKKVEDAFAFRMKHLKK